MERLTKFLGTDNGASFFIKTFKIKLLNLNVGTIYYFCI
jgi:hypothetical protein